MFGACRTLPGHNHYAIVPFECETVRTVYDTQLTAREEHGAFYTTYAGVGPLSYLTLRSYMCSSGEALVYCLIPYRLGWAAACRTEHATGSLRAGA